ncbi:LOW QUALITY PROTEIN: annexin A1-like [Lates calcarifer]|uniref:Annexin n=1 Tax=Lates calcarifer TaxID=8187 RepID=A0AAJ7PX13_LATCA|nr:LOW QUALITY PROTEIN: annexin A1-like [Lates calcarifer]
MSVFKKFFNSIIKDRDNEDDTIKVKGKPKPKYYGTVTPYPNFNASSDASVLQSAIASKGVDEDVIIAVMVQRNNEQRQKIKVVYEASTGKKLEKALKSALHSDLEDISLALLMTPAQFDAYLIRKATKRLGTDEDVLVEVLATRSNAEIRELKRIFKEEYKTDLEDVIRSETNGDFTSALLAMLKANKDESNEVNMDLARKDAETLFEAGENTSRINVSTFIDILTTRNGKQLSKTFQHYASISDVKLPKVLDMKLSGDIEDCLLDIVKCAWNTPAFFAEKLHRAMEGHGTCDSTLIRVLVSRSEVDLKKIVEEYRAMYDRSLQEHILEETKGHYEKILLGLCGPH